MPLAGLFSGAGPAIAAGAAVPPSLIGTPIGAGALASGIPLAGAGAGLLGSVGGFAGDAFKALLIPALLKDRPQQGSPLPFTPIPQGPAPQGFIPTFSSEDQVLLQTILSLLQGGRV